MHAERRSGHRAVIRLLVAGWLVVVLAVGGNAQTSRPTSPDSRGLLPRTSPASPPAAVDAAAGQGGGSVVRYGALAVFPRPRSRGRLAAVAGRARDVPHSRMGSPIQAESPRRYVPDMIAGGVIGGAVGVLVGGALGSALGCIDGCGEFDHVIGAVLGGFVGEAALMPVGVHVGNRGRGDPVGDLLVSIGTATVGVIMVNATTVEESLVIVPIAQLAAIIAYEQSTTEETREGTRDP